MTDIPTREAQDRFEAKLRGGKMNGDLIEANNNFYEPIDILTDIGLLDAMELLEIEVLWHKNSREWSAEIGYQDWGLCLFEKSQREAIKAAWYEAVNRSEQS